MQPNYEVMTLEYAAKKQQKNPTIQVFKSMVEMWY